MLKYVPSKDENISVHLYINSWILRLYQYISRNFDGNFDKKYSWEENLSNLIAMSGKTQKEKR